MKSFYRNTGPISECHVKPPFDDAGNPLPVVVVGPNGSGKTIFLSYIVDAVMEFVKEAFKDAVPLDSAGQKPYFRTIHPTQIRSGAAFSLSLLRFKMNDDSFSYYCEKSGKLEAATYSLGVRSVFTPVWDWSMDRNYKRVSSDKQEKYIDWSTGEITEFKPLNEDTIRNEILRGAHAYFPASRREKPDWLNPKSLRIGPNPFSIHFNQRLDKPIWVETCGEENISWVLDVFLDSLIDPDEQQKVRDFVDTLQEENMSAQQQNTPPIELLSLVDRHSSMKTRKNVEQILKTILQNRTAKLILNFRNITPSRISIKMDNGLTIPTLQSLSEGQSQLFHLFATIIRYGERTNLNRSVNLSQITGLVVIDEIAAHLHPTLQHDVLPELISLFPKVQFIVSSHSPLFLLGMEKRFGVNRVTILEMPEAKRINSERYSEFGKAFEYIQSTERYEEEIRQRFAAGTKPLVLTEGPLDVRYIRRALDVLGKDELLNSLDIEFVGIVDENGKTRFGGDTGLNHFRNVYEANTSLYHRPILLLYDCDTQKPPDQIGKLWVRSIPYNAENTKVEIGIENLFPPDLFQDCFYPEVPTKDGGSAKHLNKPKFCDWICEQQTADHFAKFNCVVEILREFSEAHQPPPGQQPPSE